MKSGGDAYVALVVSEAMGAAEAARLVRRALCERGETPWRAMELELYPGVAGSLVIARPAAGERVYIARSALRVLAEYRRGR